MSPLQELLMKHLPALYPRKHMQQATGLSEGCCKRILRVGVMPDEVTAPAISEGLNIRMATLTQAVRESCVGRPLPRWACKPWETVQDWEHYCRPPQEGNSTLAPRPISGSRWEKIVAEIKPSRCFVVSAERVLLDWQAFGASREQVEWAKQKLGVA